VWKKQRTVAFEHISAFQAPGNKSVYLSAYHDLLKVPPQPNELPIPANIERASGN